MSENERGLRDFHVDIRRRTRSRISCHSTSQVLLARGREDGMEMFDSRFLVGSGSGLHRHT